MRFKETMKEISENIERISYQVPEERILKFEKLIYDSEQIFIYGAGRSGFMGRALAQRLMHLRINSHYIGDSTTPYFHKNDLLVVVSGSGETTSAVAIAEKARSLEGRIALITSHPESSIGKISDLIIDIKSKTKSDLDENSKILAPYTSLFDITTLAVFDSLARVIMDEKGITDADIDKRHATVE